MIKINIDINNKNKEEVYILSYYNTVERSTISICFYLPEEKLELLNAYSIVNNSTYYMDGKLYKASIEVEELSAETINKL